MARSRDDHLWTLVHAERSSLAEDLSILDAEQWRHGTLCRQWDVEDVVAHLTAAGSLNQWRWVRSMLGAGFRTDVHNQRRMVERKGSTPSRDTRPVPLHHRQHHRPVGSHSGICRRGHRARPGHPSTAGLQRTPDVDALTPVADFFAHRNFTVPSKTAAAGLQLRANDGPFAAGSGALVTGSTLALVMSMAGRAPCVDQLDGPGVPVLGSRVIVALP